MKVKNLPGEPLMSATIQPAAAQTLDDKYCPSLQNPAVALCAGGWEKTYRATLQKTGSLYSAKRIAAVVYRMAMPPLTGHQNICDFIACTGYGMLAGAIKPEYGTKLLYAAQVALQAVPKKAKIQTPTPAQLLHSPNPSRPFAATATNEED